VSLALGQAFFTPARGSVPRHLWVIVSDPQKSSRVVVANLSTKPPADPDPELVSVAPREHPAISQQSVIRPDEARIADAKDLERLLNKDVLSPTKPASPDLVRKIQQTLGASKLTKIEIKKTLQEQGYL
jgi:hypothetical protein